MSKGLQTNITLDIPGLSISITKNENLRYLRMRSGYLLFVGERKKKPLAWVEWVRARYTQFLGFWKRTFPSRRNMTSAETYRFESAVVYSIESFRHCGGSIIR